LHRIEAISPNFFARLKINVEIILFLRHGLAEAFERER